MDNRPTLLIVDDDPKLLKSVANILEAKNYRPIMAADGKTALKIVAEHCPLVALIDLKLGDMSGLELMGKIKKLSPRTEYIVVTGYASLETAIEAVDMGAYSYMLKPYDLEQLLVTIQRAIEKQQADESLRMYRNLVESIPIGINVWKIEDPRDVGSLRLTYHNQSADEAAHTSLAPYIGTTIRQSFPTVMEIESSEIYAEVIQTGRSKVMLEMRWPGDDNVSEGFYKRSVFPIGDDHLATTFENITERKQAEQELSRLYRALEALLSDGTPDIKNLAQTIVETVLHEFGQSNCSLFLVDEKQDNLNRIAVAGPYTDEVTAGKLELDGKGIVPSTIRSGQIHNVPDVSQDPRYVPNWDGARSELAVPLKVGEQVIGVIDVQSSGRNAFNADDARLLSVFAKKASLALENVRLLEKTRRGAEALREQLYRTERMLQTSLDGYLLTNIEGELVEVNPAYCQLIGYSQEELLKMNIRDIVLQSSPEEIRQRLEQIVREGGARFESKHKRKDCRAIELEVSIVMVQTEEVPLLAAFMRDSSERKQAEQELHKHRQHLEELVEDRTVALRAANKDLVSRAE